MSQIREEPVVLSNSSPVLFLTARTEEIDRVLGFELGGDDYMSKPFSPRELVARIKAILRRSRPVVSSEGQARPTKFHIDQERLQITFQGIPLPLSQYEFRLLCILVRRAGRVYSREELMALAWETPEMSLERTIDAHVKTIRAKLRAVELRVGTILKVEDFPNARKPAYKLWVDFGKLGVKQSSAQITTLYTKEELVGQQIIGVINFPPKQIATFMSEFLTTGLVLENGDVVLAKPERPVPAGCKLA